MVTWPKLPSTAGMSEPQPAALFPLWDLLSYFFRLWFSERNQHINDFPPQKPLKIILGIFSCSCWLPGLGAVVEKRTESVPHRGMDGPELLTACVFLACVLGVCFTCWASCTRFCPYSSSSINSMDVWKSEVECSGMCP